MYKQQDFNEAHVIMVEAFHNKISVSKFLSEMGVVELQ